MVAARRRKLSSEIATKTGCNAQSAKRISRSPARAVSKRSASSRNYSGASGSCVCPSQFSELSHASEHRLPLNSRKFKLPANRAAVASFLPFAVRARARSRCGKQKLIDRKQSDDVPSAARRYVFHGNGYAPVTISPLIKDCDARY